MVLNAAQGESAGRFAAGRILKFDGSLSYDPEGEPITDFNWFFGDGSTATGPVVYRAYSAGGSYNVTLEVSTEDQTGVSERPLEVVTAIVTEGLVSAWDPCVSYGTQTYKDIISGYDGVLGSSASVESSDPEWKSDPIRLSSQSYDQFITFPSFPGGTSSSHTFVFSVDSLSHVVNQKGILIDGYGSDDVYSHWEQSARFIINGFGGVARETGAGGYADGGEHVLAVVMNGATSSMDIYIDGAHAGSTSFNGATMQGAISFLQDGFYGDLKTSAYYGRALSPSEVAQTSAAFGDLNCEGAGPAFIEVTPSEATLVPGFTEQFNALVMDSMWNPVDAEVTWSARDSSIVTIDTTGLATAHALGEVWILGQAGEAVDSALVRVVETTFVVKPTIHWSPCEGFGGQIMHDVAGGSHGVLGRTDSVDVKDPEWQMDGEGRAWWESTHWDKGQYLRAPSAETISGSFTMAFRLKANQYYKNSQLVRSGGTRSYLQIASNGSPYFNFHGYGVAGTWPADGNPFTLVVVRDMSTGYTTYYVDGVQAARRTDTRSLSLSAPLTFMHGYDNHSSYEQYAFNGSMGDIAVFNTALSAEEVEITHDHLMGAICDEIVPDSLSVIPDTATVKVAGTKQLEARLYRQGERVVGQPVEWTSREAALRSWIQRDGYQVSQKGQRGLLQQMRTG